MNYLQNPNVLDSFESIVGACLEDRYIIQKETNSTRFKVHFQSFEQCKVIGLPHPSSSRGLSHEYIELFEPEIGKIISKYVEERGFDIRPK